MTIASTINSIGYTANGVNDTFQYIFLVFNEGDLEVYVDSILQTITTHYIITNVGSPTGGNVIFEAGFIPINGASVIIYRNVPQLQGVDYVAGEKFPAETHERALDRLTTMVQQLQSEVDRSFKMARTVTDSGGVELDYSAAARANQFFGFDADGDLVLAQEFGTWRDIWTTATQYTGGDIVIDGVNGADTQNIYRATIVHTSGVWVTDLAAVKWVLVIDVEAVSDAAAEALASAEQAHQWAVNPEDDDVDNYPGEYSALHHATKAEAWHDAGFLLDPTPDSDHTVSGFRTDSLQAGENVVFGSFCYMKSDGKVWKADATDDTKAPCVYMAIETIAADASGEFLVRGFARDDSWSWTVGALLYLSTDVGELTETAPSGTGNVIQPMGIAQSATVVMLNPTYGYAEHK
jgi:hypothetical protein